MESELSQNVVRMQSECSENVVRSNKVILGQVRSLEVDSDHLSYERWSSMLYMDGMDEWDWVGYYRS